MTEIPRRICIDRQTPIEAAIRAAREAVENGPAHPHMTRATVLLGQALEAVADFVDGVPEHSTNAAPATPADRRGEDGASVEAARARRLVEDLARSTTGGAASLPPAMRAALDATGDALLGTLGAPCEGCEAPAVTMDPEGVPLCRPCAKACDEETTAEATARTVGDSLRRTLNDRTFETIVDAAKAAKASDGKGA